MDAQNAIHMEYVSVSDNNNRNGIITNIIWINKASNNDQKKNNGFSLGDVCEMTAIPILREKK